MLVCVSFFLLHTPTMTTRRMLSPKHAHKPECSSCHVNITFPSSIWRYKHRSPLKRWLFFSFSPWVIFSFTLRACQSVKPPPPATHPHLVTECRWCWHVTSGSSSLHVLHRHFSTHFPFSQEAWLWSSCNDVKKETEIPQQQLWANECILETFLCRCYRIGFLSRWRIKGDQNGSNLLLLRFLTPCLLWGDLCVGSEEWNLFSNWDEMLCGLCDSMLASVDKDMLKETFSGS